MTRPMFPFTALVGLEPLKLALQLAAVDSRLSVLVRGEKGTGKSTAARGLQPLLADGAPFVNLPIGATEDRVIGGLDIERALKGEPALKPGLLSQANGGVLYIDEVNLLPDHLADALLDAATSGLHVVEREGFSVTEDARFVLVGSMNPEEGALRPQLLDRFALAVDVFAPLDPGLRREAVERRLRYDRDPHGFRSSWQDTQEALRQRLREARVWLPDVRCSGSLLDFISEAVCQRGVASLRADLAIVRASHALASLEAAAEVTAAHVEAVLPLALNHRGSRAKSNAPPERSARPPVEPDSPRGSSDGPHDERSHVFSPKEVATPRLVVVTESDDVRGSRSGQAGLAGGPLRRTRPAQLPNELDVRPTLVHAIGRTGLPQIARDDLHEKVRAKKDGTRFIFVIDSSGSHAVDQRMRLVKGAIDGILGTSADRRDEVVLVVFRGRSATVVLEPTSDIEAARRSLEYLPTGGRTPLAHALEVATGYVTDATVLLIVTDGRANVPSRGSDPWQDALHAAAAVRCPSLVIDSEVGPLRAGRASQLAEAMGARCVALDELEEGGVLRLVRHRARTI
jgi:magnesium chelatase subunit D